MSLWRAVGRVNGDRRDDKDPYFVSEYLRHVESLESRLLSSLQSRFRLRVAPSSLYSLITPFCTDFCPASNSISVPFAIAESDVSSWMAELSRVISRGSLESGGLEKPYSSSATLLSTTVMDIRSLVGMMMAGDVC